MGALSHKVVGCVPPWLVLPGGVGRQRCVGIAPETAFHIVSRRPGQLKLLLAHMRTVLEEPQFIGHRWDGDRRRVEFVRTVGQPERLLLVSVKFLDAKHEAWVNTAFVLDRRHLTRRIAAGTLWAVSRGP
jgi:hypothetical protein